MRIIKSVVFILAFSSCSLNPIIDNYYDSMNKKKFEKSVITITDEMKELRTESDINSFISRKMTYKAESIDTWSSINTILERGYGDCDDYAMVYIALYYIVFQVKLDLICINTNETRAVIKGGSINHAIVYNPINGRQIEPQTGNDYIKPYSIKFIYKFDELYHTPQLNDHL